MIAWHLITYKDRLILKNDNHNQKGKSLMHLEYHFIFSLDMASTSVVHV